MKRILLSVFAAAITAAWAVPSSAADITLGGQYRLRGEYRSNTDFDKNTADDSSLYGQRVRLTANAKATDDTSVKITIQDTRTWGAAQSTAGGPDVTDTGTNTIDLHESYLNVNNIFGAPVSFRAGRQELVYGDERLVGAFNWSNNGRSFDALKFMYASDLANVDLFTSKIRENSTLTTGASDNDQDFYGLYATIKAIPNNTLDLYVLGLRDGQVGTATPGPTNTVFGLGNTIGNQTVTTNAAGTASDVYVSNVQKLYTYGARLKGDVVGVDYTLEIPIQTGSFKTTSAATGTTTDYKFKGYAYAAKVGYTLPTPMKLRVGVEYDYASGDKDPGSATSTDTDIKTFFNLFPTNHDKLGLMDLQAWRNVKAWNVNVTADVNEKLRLYAAWWNFKLATKLDNWYAASNWNNSPTGTRAAYTSTGAGSTNASDKIGNEVDLVATYKYNNALTIEGGYSHFFAGKFIEGKFNNTASTTDEKGNQDWAYLMFTANF